MADRTANLFMPYILPSQAQKHVTHNEALQALDAVVQLSIQSEVSAPPLDSTEGTRFIVADGATGAWKGHDGQIAAFQDGAWSFFIPREGWLAWFISTGNLRIFHNAAWTDLRMGDGAPVKFGINATADEYNRLTVASEATLFTHVGHGHQAKINKAAAADTASLLFQSNWTGRAEMGLAGDNDFSIKVSNGTEWLTALKVDSNGAVTLPHRPTGRAYKRDGVISQGDGSGSGFTVLDHARGGLSLGSDMGNGERALAIPVDGPYLLSLTMTSVSSSGYTVSLLRNRSDTLFGLSFPATAPITLSQSQVVMLSAGDELSLHHAGTAQIYNIPGASQLTLVML